jgi:hypothetical protein
MAQRVQVVHTDDLDGSAADSTTQFSYQGADYEIDLSAVNARHLAEILDPFIAAARRAPARSPARGSRVSAGLDQAAVRGWAREQGLKVSDRGRIPAAVIEQYRGAS